MALFAEPQAAVRAAQDMVEVSALFNAERTPAGQAAIALGIGIARGAVLVGTAVTTRRSAFACIGVPVPMAERLAAACSRLGCGLLMDARMRSGWGADLPSSAVPLADGAVAYTAG